MPGLFAAPFVVLVMLLVMFAAMDEQTGRWRFVWVPLVGAVVLGIVSCVAIDALSETRCGEILDLAGLRSSGWISLHCLELTIYAVVLEATAFDLYFIFAWRRRVRTR